MDDTEPTIEIVTVLQWLRDTAEEFKGCQLAAPSDVVDRLADTFRDSWLEAAANELEVP